MRRLIITLMLSVLMAVTVYAASDPMVSLFKFQSQMVLQGNVEAIMKLGEMYEQGQGTKKDLNKALEMYKKAQAQGHNGAAKAIHRIEEAKKNLEIKRKEKVAREKAVRKKAEREKIMRANVAREKAAREKVEREKIMRENAAREEAAREKVEREKIIRENAAREEAAREKAAKEKAMKARRQQEQERDQPGMGWDEEDEDGEDVDEEGEDVDESTGSMPAATK